MKGHVEVCRNLRPSPDGAGLVPVGRLARAGGWPAGQAVGAVMMDPPAICFSGETVTAARSEPVTVQFDGRYTGGGDTIVSADVERMTKAALRAVGRAADSAFAKGLGVGAVIVRCRGVDAMGRTVFVTPPSLVTATNGSVPTVMTARGINGDGHYAACEISPLAVSAFDVAVTAPAGLGEYKDRVEAVEVMVTPPLMPVSRDGMSECRLSLNGDSGCVVTISLPGIGLGAPHDAYRRMIARALERLDSLERVVAVFDPAAIDGRMARFLPAEDLSFSKNLDRVEKCLAAERPVVRGLMALAGGGSRIGSRVSRTIGDVVIRAGLSVSPQRPGAPICYTSRQPVAPGNWRGYVRVDIGDDAGCAVRAFSASAGAPLSVGPLVAFPDARARRMTIKILDSTGIVKSVTLPLTPTGDGAMAYWLADDLRPVDFMADEVGVYLVPAEHLPVADYPGAVAVSSTADPDVVMAATLVGDGSQGLTAVEVVPRSGSSVEFGRSAFYLFGENGIFTLSVNAARTSLSVSALDPRGIAGPEAVAVLPDRLLVISGDDLIELKASRVTTVARGMGMTMAAHCPATGETWLADSAGRVTVIAADGTLFSRDDITVTAMVTSEASLYLRDDDENVWLADSETPAGDGVEVEWHSRVRERRGVGCIGWAVASSSCRLRLSLAGDGGAGSSFAVPLLSLMVDGEVNHPIVSRVVAPPRHALTLCVKGTVAADTVLTDVNLYFRER